MILFLLFGKSPHVTKHRTIPKVFAPRLFVPLSKITKVIFSTSSTFTRDTSNKNTKNSSSGQGFVSDVENPVTTETNADLTKEHKDKDITDKYNFLFNSGSVNCGQFVEFKESDGCLYQNSNYKYQYEKQKLSENKMEFECGDFDNANVKNRLKQNIKFWSETLKANKVIVNVLKEGYKLPLYTMPKSAHFNNNKSAITHSNYVSEAIQDLLKENWIIEVNELPHVVNPLSVPVQNSGKKGLILHLRYVNKLIYKECIKIEDLRLMEQFLNPHDYMFKFDIKQGYHHIDILYLLSSPLD